MNRLFISMLLLMGIFMLTCNNDNLDSFHKDYRFRTKLETETDLQNLCVNGAVPLTIRIEKNDPQIGSYDFSYSPTTGKGLLFYKDSLLTPFKPIVCNEENLKLKYIPTNLGEHRLRFDFKNDLIDVSELFTGKTVKQYFQLNAKNLPSKPLVDVPFLFNIELLKPDDGIESLYKTSVRTTTGIGKAIILNNNFSDSTQNEKYLTKGDNKISYTGNTTGTHNLHFTVSNTYGLSQILDIPIEIQNPDFSVETICDTNIQSGKYSFLLKIRDTDHHGNNSYWVSYRNIANDGTLKMNNNPLESGNTLQLKNGENICEFTPLQLGYTSLEFIVRDKYNTIRKDTAEFNVLEATTEILVSNFQMLSHVYDQQNFNVAISRKNYEGSYQIEILQDPDFSELYINGIFYSGGRIPVLNKDNTLISYIPNITGKTKLILSVYDGYGSNYQKELNLEIENSQGKINVSNQNPSVNLFNPTSFNFSVYKPQYTNKYLFEIESIPVQSSIIKINGENYNGGKIEVENPDNTLVTFEPSRIGDITLRLKVYDIFGGTLTKDITYAVTNTDIQILVTNLSKELIVGNESSFTFTTEKPFFEQDLLFSVTAEPADHGLIHINNEYFLPGTALKVKNKASNTISFLPQKEGEVTLYINVWDNYSGSRSYPVILNVTNPDIRLEISNRPEKLYYKNENRFSFSVNKESYKGKFKCNIFTEPSQSGTVTLNNQPYNNEIITLDHPENNIINFIPTVTGQVSLTLQISDETQSNIKRSFNYTVENSPIKINLSNVENDLSLYKQNSFSFSVNKNNYTGKFKYELYADNCSDLKVNNVSYVNGQKQELISPEGTSISFVPSIIGNDTVKLLLRVFDEWGGNTETKLRFSVNNTDISFELSNLESRLLLGQNTTFSVTAQKPQYSGKLDIEILTTPDNTGVFTINGKEYHNGKTEISSGLPVSLTYTPSQKGEVKVDVIVSDKFGGRKTRSFNYEITNPPIELEISDFVSSAIVNTENFFYVTAHKGFYKDLLSYSVTLVPANTGSIRINDTTYTGGRINIPNAKQTKFCFIPSSSGPVTLHLKVSDNTGKSIDRELKYSVATYPVNLTVANQETGLEINKTTTFNFSVTQKGYKGKFLYEITSEPVKAGIIKTGLEIYEGGKQEITNPDNTRISFTPEIIGDLKLIINIYDDQEGTTTKELAFNVKNSDFELIGSNLEKDILIGKPTEFNIAVLKPNYSGKYKFEIEQVPANSGNIMVNGTSYISGKQILSNPVNTIIRFTSFTAGMNTLTCKVYDENGGSTQQSFNFNVINPPIILTTTNKENELIIHTATNFNVAIDKQYYSGDFSYQIDQQPANSGEISVNGQPYDGGIHKVDNPQNLKILFVPHVEKNTTLKLIVKDQVAGVTEQEYSFSVSNPPLQLGINNHTPDIRVNAPATFNFNVHKNNYPGKYYYQLVQEPSDMGIIEMNGEVYDGGKHLIENPASNEVRFTANRLGAVTLSLHITDEWEKEITERVSYSVANTDLQTEITNKENTLLLNKPTNFNLNVSKPNYSGNYHLQITTEPEKAGHIQINNSDYSSDWVKIQASNEIKFIPQITGAVLMKLKIKDAPEGEKEIALNYSVENPDIEATFSNKEENLVFNTPTSFNTTISKPFYSGNFKFQIIQNPANSGTILFNKESYEGGIQAIPDPENLQITFIPKATGNVSLDLQITDAVGGKLSKTLNFTVANPDIKINVNNHISDLIVNSPVAFNFTVTKSQYTGAFTYQIIQNPAGTGSIKVNGSKYDGGKLPLVNPDNNLIEFTPAKLGATTLHLKVEDEWGKENTYLIPFSVSNSDLKITTTGKENALLLNQNTQFNFSIEKPNYSGSFELKIESQPKEAGIIKINGNNYTAASGWVTVNKDNKLEFIPKLAGATLLNAKIRDELKGEKEIAWNFEVINPDINIQITNKEDNLLYNTSTSFNTVVSKEFYSDDFQIQISQNPANAGIISLNNNPYDGGIVLIPDPQNCQIRFTPQKEGHISLNLQITDAVGGKLSKTLNFTVANPEINVEVTNHIANILVNSSTKFNFVTSKENYNGNYFYQITQTPAASGTIAVNGKPYDGSKLPLLNPNANLVEYLPSQTGAVTLNLIISDEWGKVTTTPISYSISNSDTKVNINAKEYSLLLGKVTSFNFDIIKSGYKGNFDAQIQMEPSDAGELKLNNSAYISGWTSIKQSANLVEFIPRKPGAVLLKLKVRDDFNDEKEIAVNYEINNPEIQINVTNHQKDIIINTATTCNFSLVKSSYTGNYDCEILTIPTNLGILKINNTPYSGGLVKIQNPDNTLLEFTPNKEGRILLEIRIKDETGAESTKTLEFNVQNPPLNLTINNPTSNLSIGQTSRFTIKANKEHYSGNFNYEITAYPYAAGDISVGNKPDLSGVLDNSLTEIAYTANTLGNITLKIKISDSWGKSTEKEVDFKVSDTPLTIDILNQEKNLILNQPTNFNFIASKINYRDDKTISYSISPSHNIQINNKTYSGGVVQAKYAEIKSGIPVTYTPDRTGNVTLTINAYDEYNQNTQKTLDFGISDPKLNMFLSGINEEGNNPINLNETFTFTLNVSKDYYSDDFAYWISAPADAVLLAANDVTPRTKARSTDNSGTVTGTIPGSEFGMSTAEIRITPNNETYLDKNISLNIRVRDKWENEVIKTVTFHITTSNINLNVVRNSTSIPVLNAYQFYFTASKPNYTGGFKFSITGASDEDILETSSDGTKFTPYKGGKFELTTPDHTYIRYTPHNIGTAPLVLFVYDDNASFIEKNISFDVRAPQIQLSGGGAKSGVINEFIPFSLTATEEQGNNLNVQFNVDDKLDGTVLFNETNVYNSSNRSALKTAPLTILSGATNNLKMMSRQKGEYYTEIEVSNLWNNTASATSRINVSEPSSYTLTINKTGEGEVTVNPQLATYPAGSFVQITAKPATGYEFGGWSGDLSGSSLTQSIQMNSNKAIEATFTKKPTEKVMLNFSVEGNVTPPSNEQQVVNFALIIYETETNKPVFNSNIYFPMYPTYPFELDIDRNLEYTVKIDIRAKNFDNTTSRARYELTNIIFEFFQSDGKTIKDSSTSQQLTKTFNIKGSVLCDTKSENAFKGKAIYKYYYY